MARLEFAKCTTLCLLQELHIWSANAALVGNRGFGEYIDSIQDLFGSFLCVIYSWIGSNQFSECTMVYIKIRRTRRRWIYRRVSPCTVFFIAVTSDNQPACQKQSKLSQAAARSVAFYPMNWGHGCVSARVQSSL